MTVQAVTRHGISHDFPASGTVRNKLLLFTMRPSVEFPQRSERTDPLSGLGQAPSSCPSYCTGGQSEQYV